MDKSKGRAKVKPRSETTNRLKAKLERSVSPNARENENEGINKRDYSAEQAWRSGGLAVGGHRDCSAVSGVPMLQSTLI